MSGGGRRRPAARALLVIAGAAGTRLALARVRRLTAPGGTPVPGWARTNYRGTTVDLAGGPVLAGVASVTAAAGAPGARSAAAVLVAGLASGGVGLYDDLVGHRPGQHAKGFHGHLAALRGGRVTSGLVKLLGVGAGGLAAAALLPRPDAGTGAAGAQARRRGAVELLLGAGVIAGSANLLNLLDLRPGRALKVGLLAGAPLLRGAPGGGLVAGPVGAAVAALPDDLGERTMLGDCGANALGAVLGTALAARTGPFGRALVLAAIGALTATSERVSFTEVIARTGWLRALDEWGRPRAGRSGAPHRSGGPAG